MARRTVDRIMRANGWRGANGARRTPCTTERDPAATWAPTLLVVADFTYVPMTRGFGYTAVVVDAHAGLIGG